MVIQWGRHPHLNPRAKSRADSAWSERSDQQPTLSVFGAANRDHQRVGVELLVHEDHRLSPQTQLVLADRDDGVSGGLAVPTEPRAVIVRYGVKQESINRFIHQLQR